MHKQKAEQTAVLWHLDRSLIMCIINHGLFGSRGLGSRSETAVQFIKFAIMRGAFLGGRKVQKHEVAADDLGMENQKMTEPTEGEWLTYLNS